LILDLEYPINKKQFGKETTTMAENKNEELMTPEEGSEVEIYTLTDENGNEIDFELLAYATINGTVYYAMIPVDSQLKGADGDVFEEYVILKSVIDENGEESLESIDDDEEFDAVADYFDDKFDEEFNYDE